MKETVTIYRDVYAVPHIYAKNEEDLYRAVGYIMAQDRLWQMDLLRRVTTGRLAEIFGAELVETDLLMRALRISEKSKAILAGSNPKIINTLEAFTDGINQFIEKNKNILPPEFSLLGYKPEKWEITHSLNVVGYMAWDLTMPWPFELTLYKVAQKIGPGSERFKELIPNINFQEPPVFPDFSLVPDTPQLELKTTLLSGNLKLETLGLGVFHGSNNWAISGKKSATGKPVLANDMHLGLFAPGIWYPMHQVVSGVDGADDMLNVTGVAVPGQPFIVAGHNDKIAWGMTNLMVDDMDFYRETINPDNPNQYRFNHEWKNMEIKVEKIRIKGGNSVERKLRFTHRGPIISEFKGIQNEAISMRWTGNESSDEMRSVYLLNRAANWKDFREAVKTFIAVSQNIAYADVNGNIGLQTCAGIPIRQGYDQFVVPGETDAYDWIGLVPFEKLPFVFNPECGYVSSANNKATANDYPYYISYWYETPCRICRIREMLTAKDKLSIDDMKQVQTNVKSSLVERLMGDIILILKQAKDLNEPETRALALLYEWDGTLTKQSAAAA
ncbi:MAG TPA: penicillin acylase family protein, partial [Candidatus Deferrimicrobium sp.]|nr:penicillin acylase family protein [Candidatus Deferrimicrobium sp.]